MYKLKPIRNVKEIVGGQYYIRVYVSPLTREPVITVLKLFGKVGTYRLLSLRLSYAFRYRITDKGDEVNELDAPLSIIEYMDLGISEDHEHYARLFPFSNKALTYLQAAAKQDNDFFGKLTNLEIRYYGDLY